LRNVCALWDQALEFFRQELSPEDFDELQKDLHERDSYDSEFSRLIAQQPRQLSLSMLPTYRKIVIETLERRDQEICNECEDERNKVRAAKWSYFTSGLRRDWERLTQIPIAIREARTLCHDDYVEWLDEQTKKGAKAVEWWQGRYFKMHLVQKTAHVVKLFIDFRKSIKSRSPTLQEPSRIVKDCCP